MGVERRPARDGNERTGVDQGRKRFRDESINFQRARTTASVLSTDGQADGTDVCEVEASVPQVVFSNLLCATSVFSVEASVGRRVVANKHHGNMENAEAAQRRFK